MKLKETTSHRTRTVATNTGFASICSCGWVTPTDLKDPDDARKAADTHVVAALRNAK